MTANDREQRLIALKVRLDAIHDTVIHALRAHDDAAIDRAMEQQHKTMLEYNALLSEQRRDKAPSGAS